MAVGTVFVDVVPSTDKFVGRMADDLEKQGDKLGKDLGRRIADGVGKNLGRQIADDLPQLADFQRVSDAAGKAGTQAGKRFSQGLINEARKLTADLREATNVEAVIRTRLEVNRGALDEVRRDIYELGAPRINVGVDVDDDELNFLAEKLKLDEHHLQVQVDVDEGNLPQARKSLDLLGDRARDMPDIRFNADFQQVDAAGRSVTRLRDSLEEADKSTRRFMSKPQEYALLAISAFTPASAAVLGFAAAGLAAIAPIAAIALGFDGIKAAVAPLNGNLQILKSNINAAFVEGLAPVVGNIGRLFPALNSGLSGTATALSGVAVEMTSVAAEAQNVELLDRVFRNMNEAVVGLGPPMATLTQNTLRFADIGASAMVVIGPILNEVGAAWTSMIDKLVDTGAGEHAVVALVQVLGSLLTLAAPLVQLGAEMFAAIGPGLAAGINGVAAVVSVLANAFGSLPGPIQTVIAAALILRTILALMGKTMGGVFASIGQFAGQATSHLVSPFRAASDAMSQYDARLRGTGEQLALFGTGAAAAGKQATDAGQRVGQAGAGYATHAAAAENGSQRVRTAMTSVESVASGSSSRIVSWLQAPIPAANAAGASFNNYGTQADKGLSTAAAAVQSKTSGMVGWLQAPIPAANTGGSAFGKYGQLASQGLSTASAAVQSGTSRMVSWLQAPISSTQTSGAAFSKLGTMITTGMTAAGTAVSSGSARITSGLSTLVSGAARAGTGMAAGFKVGVSGIMGVLGGPWGAAITGAMVLLSLFGDAMAQNSQKQAEFQQSVRQTADAMRESGGAVTDSMRASEAYALAQTSAGQSAKDLGLNIMDLTNAAINSGAGWDGLKAQLTATATAGREVQYSSIDMGGALSDAQMAIVNQGSAAQGLLDQLGPLEAKYREAALANQAYEFAIRSSGNSMAQGLGVAAQLTTAFTTLQGAMSTTEDKAKALASALGLLFGQPLSAEAALGAARLALGDLKTKMEAAKTEANGLGQGMLTAAGRINMNTKAGQELAVAMDGTRATLAQAAVSAFDAAGGTTNLAGAQAAARGTVQGLRDQFVSQMTAITGNAAAANTYANELGLIPDVIVTLLSMNSQGLDKAKQDLALVSSMIKSMPAGQTTITAALSGEAADLLRKAGVGVVDVGNGMFQVEANDRTKPIIEGILAYITGQNPKVPTDADPSKMPGQVEGAVAGANPAPVPVPVDTNAIMPGIQDAVGNTVAPPVPVNGDAAPLQGDVQTAVGNIPAAQVEVVLKNVQDIENTINRIRQNLTAPILMTLDVNDAAIGKVDATKARAAEPVTFNLDAVDVAFGRVNATKAAAATPVTFTFDAVDVAFGRINATKQAATTPVTFTFDAIDIAFGRINATKQAATTPVTFTFDAIDIAFGRINATKQAATTPVTFTFDCIDVAVGRMAATKSAGAAPVTFTYDANDVAIGRINATKAVGAAPVTFNFDANDTAIGRINATKAVATRAETFPFDVIDNAIAKVNSTHEAARKPESFSLSIANAGAISSQLDSIAHDRTVTYRIVTVGAPPPPGNALGNIHGFAKGGFNGLTPMTGGRAKLVQPNTWRVVGDRASKPEAYIPIDSAPRSRALLSYTAKAMGYALQPMAQGGIGSEDTLRLAQLARQRVGTQTVGAMQTAQSMPGSGDKSGQQQAKQLTEIATLLKEQAASPRTITVEDRSGNPTETARASALAFRLAR